MSEYQKVMISCTRTDLSEHIKQAKAAIEQWRGHLIVMENLPASPKSALDVSYELVDDADIYLGIFAHRYGYVPEDPRNPDRLSITELEYRRAGERGIPRLIFFMHEDQGVKPETVETGEGAARLKKFKEYLGKELVVAFFKSPEDLRAHVQFALTSLKNPFQTHPDSDSLHVFVSHASEDDNFVDRLNDDLKTSSKCKLWIDHVDISPGTDWQNAIDDALRTCSWIFVIISKYSIRSSEVRAEWRAALNLGKRLFVIIIDDTELNDLSSRLHTIQSINLAENWKQGIFSLANVINGSKEIVQKDQKTFTQVSKPGVTMKIPLPVDSSTQDALVNLVGKFQSQGIPVHMDMDSSPLTRRISEL